MLLLYYLWFADNPKIASGKYWARIAGPERLERAQVSRKPESNCRSRNFGVDVEGRNQLLLGQGRSRVFIQAPPEFRNAFAPDAETGRVRVTAEFFEQIATRRQTIEKVVS